jgi:hypothetical protein
VVRIGRIGPDPDNGGWWWVVLVVVGVLLCIAFGVLLTLVAIEVIARLVRLA